MKNIKFYLFVCCTLLLVSCGKDPNGSTDGTFKDSRDQHVYKYVKIGTQTWMTENLAWLPTVSRSSDGSESSAFYYVYNSEGSSVAAAKATANYDIYGVLYNWEAAKIACPSGWHLPSDAEWTILEGYLGAPLGKKMKSKTGWSLNGNGDNSSGFNALPGGIRNDTGDCYALSVNAEFWSSSEDGSNALSRILFSNPDEMALDFSNRSHGFSVRCLQNNMCPEADSERKGTLR